MDSLVLIDGRPVEYFFAGPPIAKNILADRAAIGSVTADGKIDIGEFSPDASLEWSEADGTAGKLLLVRYEKSDLGAVQLPPGAQLWVPGEQLGESWSESARAIDPLFERDAGNFAIVTNEDANPIQLIFAEIEPLPLAQSVFEPLPLTDTERKIYSINGEKKKINNREVGNADYVINGTSLPKVLSFGAELLQPTTIHRVTLNRGSLPLVVKRRSVDSTVISGHPDATWILPDGRMLRGDLVLTGSIRGSVLLAADGDRGIPVEVETEDVQPLRCRRCRAQFLPSENYHGACQWHTQHAQLLRIEAEQKLTTINSVITSELEDKPFSSLLRRLNGSLQQSIESKLNFLETATPNRLTLSRSPREMVVSELRKLIEDYRAATNAEELAVRRYARVVVHLLDSRQLKDCLQLPYFDPQDPDQRQIGGFRNPNKRYGLTEDVWQCCGFSGGQRGCWIGRHAETEFPDLQDALNDQRGSQHLSDPNTSEDSYREILAAKEAQDYETLFTLEGLYNEVQGGVLVLPADADDSVKRAVKSLDLTESETTSYWVRDEQRSLTFDGIPDDDLFTKARRSQEYKEREAAKLIFAPPSPPRGEESVQVVTTPKRFKPQKFTTITTVSEEDRQNQFVADLIEISNLKRVTLDQAASSWKLDATQLTELQQKWRQLSSFVNQQQTSLYFNMEFKFDVPEPEQKLPDLQDVALAIEMAWLKKEEWEEFQKFKNPLYEAYKNAVDTLIGYLYDTLRANREKDPRFSFGALVTTPADDLVQHNITSNKRRPEDLEILRGEVTIRTNLLSDWDGGLFFQEYYEMKFINLDQYDAVWQYYGVDFKNVPVSDIKNFLEAAQDKVLQMRNKSDLLFERYVALWSACVYPSAPNLRQLADLVGLKAPSAVKPPPRAKSPELLKKSVLKEAQDKLLKISEFIEDEQNIGFYAVILTFPVQTISNKEEAEKLLPTIEKGLKQIEKWRTYDFPLSDEFQKYKAEIVLWAEYVPNLRISRASERIFLQLDSISAPETFLKTVAYVGKVYPLLIWQEDVEISLLTDPNLSSVFRFNMIFPNILKYGEWWKFIGLNLADEQATAIQLIEMYDKLVNATAQEGPDKYAKLRVAWTAIVNPTNENMDALRKLVAVEVKEKQLEDSFEAAKKELAQVLTKYDDAWPSELASYRPKPQKAQLTNEASYRLRIATLRKLTSKRETYFSQELQTAVALDKWISDKETELKVLFSRFNGATADFSNVSAPSNRFDIAVKNKNGDLGAALEELDRIKNEFRKKLKNAKKLSKYFNELQTTADMSKSFLPKLIPPSGAQKQSSAEETVANFNQNEYAQLKANVETKVASIRKYNSSYAAPALPAQATVLKQNASESTKALKNRRRRALQNIRDEFAELLKKLDAEEIRLKAQYDILDRKVEEHKRFLKQNRINSGIFQASYDTTAPESFEKWGQYEAQLANAVKKFEEYRKWQESFEELHSKYLKSRGKWPEKFSVFSLSKASYDEANLDEISRAIFNMPTDEAVEYLKETSAKVIDEINDKLSTLTFTLDDLKPLRAFLITNIEIFKESPSDAVVEQEKVSLEELEGLIAETPSGSQAPSLDNIETKEQADAALAKVAKQLAESQAETMNLSQENAAQLAKYKEDVNKIIADLQAYPDLKMEFFAFKSSQAAIQAAGIKERIPKLSNFDEWKNEWETDNQILISLKEQAKSIKNAFYTGSTPLKLLAQTLVIERTIEGLNSVAPATKKMFKTLTEEPTVLYNGVIAYIDKDKSLGELRELFFRTTELEYPIIQNQDEDFAQLFTDREKSWLVPFLDKIQSSKPLKHFDYKKEYDLAYRDAIYGLLQLNQKILGKIFELSKSADVEFNLRVANAIITAIKQEIQDSDIEVGSYLLKKATSDVVKNFVTKGTDPETGFYFEKEYGFILNSRLEMPAYLGQYITKFNQEYIMRRLNYELAYFLSKNQKSIDQFKLNIDEFQRNRQLAEPVDLSSEISEAFIALQRDNLFDASLVKGITPQKLRLNAFAALASLTSGNRDRTINPGKIAISGVPIYWVLLQIANQEDFLQCIEAIGDTDIKDIRLFFDLNPFVKATVYLSKEETALSQIKDRFAIYNVTQTVLATITITQSEIAVAGDLIELNYDVALRSRIAAISALLERLPLFAFLINDDELETYINKQLIKELSRYPFLTFGFRPKVKMIGKPFLSKTPTGFAIPYAYEGDFEQNNERIPQKLSMPRIEIVKTGKTERQKYSLANLNAGDIEWKIRDAPVDMQRDETARFKQFEDGLKKILRKSFDSLGKRNIDLEYYVFPLDDPVPQTTSFEMERNAPKQPLPASSSESSKKSPPPSPKTPKASQPSPKSPPKPKSPPPPPESSEDEGSTEEVPPEVPKPKDVPTGKDATLFESASFEKLQQMKNANSPAYLLRRTTAKSLTNNIYWNWAQTLKEPAKDRSSSYKNESFSGLSLPLEYYNNLEWMLTFIQDDVSLEGIQELAGEEWAKPIVDPKTKLVKPGLKTVPKEYAVRNEFYSIIPIPFPIMDIALLRQYYALSDTYPSNRIAIRSTHISPRIDIGTVAERMWNARLCDGDVIEKFDRTQLELHKDETKKAITPNEEFAGLAKKYGVKKLVDTFKGLWELQKVPPDPKTLSNDMAILIHLIHSLKRSAELYAFTEELVIRARNTYQDWETPETFDRIKAKLPKAKTFEDLKDFQSDDIQDALLRTLDSATLERIWKLSVQGFFTNIFLQDELLTEATEDIRIYSVAELNQDDSIRHTIGHAIGRVDSWEKTLESLRYGDGIELKAGKQNLEIEEIVVRKKSNMGQPLLLKMVLDHYASLQQQVESPEKVFVWLKPDLQLFAAGTDNFAEVYQAPKEGLLDLYAKWGFRPDFNVDVPIQLTKIKKLSLRPDSTTVLDDWRLGYLTGALMEIGAREATDVPEPSSLWGPKVGKTGFEGYLNFKVKFAKTMKDFKDVPVPKMQPIYSNSVFNAEQPEDEDRILFRQVKDAAEYTFVKGGAIEVALGNLAPASPAPPPAKKARGRPKKTSQSSEQIQSLENIVDLTSARNPIMGLLFELDDNDMLAPHGYGEFNTWLQEWTKRRTSIGLSFDFPVPLTARRDAILARIDPDLRTLGSQAAQRLAQMK